MTSPPASKVHIKLRGVTAGRRKAESSSHVRDRLRTRVRASPIDKPAAVRTPRGAATPEPAKPTPKSRSGRRDTALRRAQTEIAELHGRLDEKEETIANLRLLVQAHIAGYGIQAAVDTAHAGGDWPVPTSRVPCPTAVRTAIAQLGVGPEAARPAAFYASAAPAPPLTQPVAPPSHSPGRAASTPAMGSWPRNQPPTAGAASHSCPNSISAAARTALCTPGASAGRARSLSSPRPWQRRLSLASLVGAEQDWGLAPPWPIAAATVSDLVE